MGEMSERLTESEKASLSTELPGGIEQWRWLIDAVEQILTDRLLAARGAGDGLAGRVAALADEWDRTWCAPSEARIVARLAADLRALLDPDTQGANEVPR